MKFTEVKPHLNIAPFVDAYWELKNCDNFTILDKVIPDGCIDLIINLGEEYLIESENCSLKSEKAYLGGAITEVKENKIRPNTHLLGVRFKPAGFSHFYSFSSLHETTNHCVELDQHMVPDLKSLSGNFSNAFDRFYANRFIQPKHFMLPVVNSVQKLKGQVSVNDLAEINCTTVRQLERTFKYYTGLTPKEYIGIVRFKFARELIASSYPERTLLDIALECGYYDHAHLGNEIKKYTNLSPSQL